MNRNICGFLTGAEEMCYFPLKMFRMIFQRKNGDREYLIFSDFYFYQYVSIFPFFDVLKKRKRYDLLCMLNA